MPKFVYLDVNRDQCRFDAVVQARLEALPLNPTCKTFIKRNELVIRKHLCMPTLNVKCFISEMSYKLS